MRYDETATEESAVDPVDGDPVATADPVDGDPVATADPVDGDPVATADLTPTEVTGSEPVATADLIGGRWVHPEPCFNPEVGIIQYGDPIPVTPEQLEDPNTPAIAWDDNWQPDPDVEALVPPAPAAAAEEG